jgi:hypothetical protein
LCPRAFSAAKKARRAGPALTFSVAVFAFLPMKFTHLLLGLPVAALLASVAHRPAAPAVTYDLVITHVNVVDVVSGRLRPDQSVAVAGGKIVRVGPETQAHYQARQKVDGTGRFLMPGLWDMQ